MSVELRMHSQKKGELNSFLSKFYNTPLEIENSLKWKKNYENPLDLCDIIGAFIDNIDEFDIKMWISLDKNIFIDITEQTANLIIKYLFERYPY